jgi:ABC-type multidrug transport system fused ATPase/permease subunit
LLVIAHRLASVQESDRILLLVEKQLLAVGTRSALLRDNANYQQLVANLLIFTSNEPTGETPLRV